MRYFGRLVACCSTLMIHSIYIFYYQFRDGKIELFDLYSTPFLLLVAYWAGLQFDKVRYLSEKDILTGLYNRRFVIKRFKRAMNSKKKGLNTKLTVLVMDCDNFKYINDYYGHDNGDMVLKMISEALVESTRKDDIVARWGGDEFLVIGHYNQEKELQMMLKRFECTLRNLTYLVKKPITVSIGSAVYSNQSQDLFDLMRIADDNMYKQKIVKKNKQNAN